MLLINKMKYFLFYLFTKVFLYNYDIHKAYCKQINVDLNSLENVSYALVDAILRFCDFVNKKLI